MVTAAWYVRVSDPDAQGRAPKRSAAHRNGAPEG
jgi:hypothetical protein